MHWGMVREFSIDGKEAVMPTLKATLSLTGEPDVSVASFYTYSHNPSTDSVIDRLQVQKGAFGGDPESPPKEILVSIDVPEPNGGTKVDKEAAYENLDKISQTGEFRGKMGMM